MKKLKIWIITCFYFSGQIQGRNWDSQLSVFLTLEWGQNSSDASSVSGVWDVSNASKASAAIFVSDASNGNGNISRKIRDAINDMLAVTLVMLLRLLTLDSSGQIHVRIGAVNCFYSSRSHAARIAVMLVTSVLSGTRVILVRLVTCR